MQFEEYYRKNNQACFRCFLTSNKFQIAHRLRSSTFLFHSVGVEWFLRYIAVDHFGWQTNNLKSFTRFQLILTDRKI